MPGRRREDKGQYQTAVENAIIDSLWRGTLSPVCAPSSLPRSLAPESQLALLLLKPDGPTGSQKSKPQQTDAVSNVSSARA